GDEYTGRRRLQRRGVDTRPTGTKLFHVAAAVAQEAEVGGLPGGDQNRVASDQLALVVVENRREAALVVVHPQAAAKEHSGHLPATAATDLERPPTVEA